MKLTGASVGRFVRKPDPQIRAALIYGDDPALVAARRDQLRGVILGDESPELRLTRLDAALVRKDAAALFDALRETAFFGGRRLVQIDAATDGMAKMLADAIADMTDDDAFLLVTAASLPARSKLRATFEGPGVAAALPCYADSVGAEDITEALSEFGLRLADSEAEAALRAQRADLDFGAYQRLLEKLAIYKINDAEPVAAEDVLACAPLPDDPEAHAIAGAALNGDVAETARELARIASDPAAGSALLIALSWQMKRLYGVIAELESGASRDRALAVLRPPVFGESRSRLTRQLDRWSGPTLESALRLVQDTQLASRSAGVAQPAAAVARATLRIAMMASSK